MKIELDMTHDAPPEAVFDMMTDPAFVELRCKASGAINFTQDVTVSGTDTLVTVERAMPADDLPDLLQNFARGGIKVHEVLTWGPAASDGSRTAQIALDFAGQPMKMRGTMELTATKSGATLAVRADLKAAIPLLGGKIEKLTAPLIIQAIKSEETVGREWLEAAR